MNYKQKEIIGNATLYLGDCLPIMEGMKENEVDAVVTDPPYGLGEAAGKNESRGKLAKATMFTSKAWDNSTPNSDIFTHVKRISCYQVIFGGNYFDLEPTSCWLVWDKVNGDSDFADCELAWTNLKKAVRLIKYRWAGMLQQDMKNKEERVHPTQKPIPVMVWCIGHLPIEEDSLILDPFMGSGTTGIAAHKTGHRFIGIEQDEDYFNIACKRIEQAQKQGNLF